MLGVRRQGAAGSPGYSLYMLNDDGQPAKEW
jgi:hypothetical protein